MILTLQLWATRRRGEHTPRHLRARPLREWHVTYSPGMSRRYVYLVRAVTARDACQVVRDNVTNSGGRVRAKPARDGVRAYRIET